MVKQNDARCRMTCAGTQITYTARIMKYNSSNPENVILNCVLCMEMPNAVEKCSAIVYTRFTVVENILS